MRLTPAALREFKEIYREEFGGELSDADAEACGLRLLRLFNLILETTAQHGQSPVVDGIGTLKKGQVR